MAFEIPFSEFRWINQPNRTLIEDGIVTLFTEPLTDLWQRSYYGFQHDNAHAFIFPAPEQEFTFSVRASWQPATLFDQAGVVLYQDAENWFKASVEYENEVYSRLGSVVTNLGYSDWATTDVSSEVRTMVYRLSRRQQDFLIENSEDGQNFKQMRVFHMHQPLRQVNIGIYACSPLASSFRADFSDFSYGECLWELYQEPTGSE